MTTTLRPQQHQSEEAANDAAPTPTEPTLAEVQERMQRAILAGDDSLDALILDNSRTGRATLLGVYRHAYVGRLTDVLRNDYPTLAALVGPETFAELARGYVAAHPSRTQNARWFGARFPSYLAGLAAAKERPELGEVATIEKLVADAFDAVDAPVLSAADLARYAPEDWGRLVLVPHPSVSSAAARTNGFVIWMALNEGEAPPSPTAAPEGQVVVAWRGPSNPMVRELVPEEAMLWIEATRGARFDQLCSMAALFDDPDGAAARAAGYLGTWLAAGMLTDARLT